MKKTILLIWLILLLTTPQASAETKFSSVYTNANYDCPNALKDSEVGEGQDMPLLCKGVAPYNVYIYFSACCSYFTVIKGTDPATAQFVEDAAFNEPQKVEWRMADGKPFAVIYKYAEAKLKWGRFSIRYKEHVAVQGLLGFDKIKFNIDPSKESDPAAKARELADMNFDSGNLGTRLGHW